MGLHRLLQRKSGDATDKSSKRCKETAGAGCRSGPGVPGEPVPGAEQAAQVSALLHAAQEQRAGETHLCGAPGLCSRTPQSLTMRPAEDVGP